MSKKIIIECPNCGVINEASVGFFSKRKIECKCGHIIKVNDAKFVTKECPNCGNLIVYNKAKNPDPLCPVCHEHLITEKEDYKFVEVICEECSCHITAKKDDSVIECPICGKNIDVQKRLREQEYIDKQQPSLLKSAYENNVILYKHPLQNFRIGSQIVVNESETALFLTDGKCIGIFDAGKHTIEIDNLQLSKDNFDNDCVSFTSNLYFVSKVLQSNLKWGTDSKVRMYDPATGLHIELGACGTFNYKIKDFTKFVFEVVGLGPIAETGLTSDEFSISFKATVVKVVKSELAKAIRENSIDILEIDEHLVELSNILLDKVNNEVKKLGIEVSEFNITNIMTPDYDPNFRRLKEQHAERYLKVQEERIGKEVADAHREKVLSETKTTTDVELEKAKAEAEAERIRAQGKADAYRAQAEAEADEMKMKGYTYQDETKRQVATGAVIGSTIGSSNGSSGDTISGLASEAVKAGVIKEMGKEITHEVVDSMKGASATVKESNPEGWTCLECGTKGITSNFCPNCGAKKPVASTWDCPECGTKGITSNFCPNCGKKKE